MRIKQQSKKQNTIVTTGKSNRNFFISSNRLNDFPRQSQLEPVRREILAPLNHMLDLQNTNSLLFNEKMTETSSGKGMIYVVLFKIEDIQISQK